MLRGTFESRFFVLAIAFAMLSALGVGFLLSQDGIQSIALALLGLVVGIALLALIAKYPIVAIWLFALTLPLDELRAIAGLGSGVTPARIAGLAVIYALFIDLIRKRRAVILSTEAKIFGVFVAWSLVSIIWSEAGDVKFQFGLTLVQLFLLYVATLNLVRRPWHIWVSAVMVAIGGSVILWLATTTALSGEYRSIWVSEGLSPNRIPGYVALGYGAAVVVLLFGQWSFAYRIPAALFVGATWLGALSIITRSAILALPLALLVAIVFGVFSQPNRRRQTTVRLVAITVLLGLVLVAFSQLLPEQLLAAVDTRIRQRETILLRGAIWQVLLMGWLASPVIGHGLAGSSLMINLPEASAITASLGVYAADNYASHNIFLTALSELGIIGFGLLCWFAIRHTIHLIISVTDRRLARPPWLWVNLFLLVALVVVLAQGMTENVQVHKLFWFPFALVDASWMLASRQTGRIDETQHDAH